MNTLRKNFFYSSTPLRNNIDPYYTSFQMMKKKISPKNRIMKDCDTE